jgi:hypothetical protein
VFQRAGVSDGFSIAVPFDLYYLRKPAFVVEAVNPVLLHSRHPVVASRLYDTLKRVRINLQQLCGVICKLIIAK